MIDYNTLIILLFIIIIILTAVCIGLLDSRDYWRKKWLRDEDYILELLRNGNK